MLDLEDGDGKQVLNPKDKDGKQVRGLEDGSKQLLELEDGNGKQVWGLEDGQGVSGALLCGAELLAKREGGDNLGAVLPGGALA